MTVFQLFQTISSELKSVVPILLVVDTTGYRILGKACGYLQKAQVAHCREFSIFLRVFATFQKFAGRQFLENNLHLLE